MKKEKTLAITLYVFSIIALCYATFLLFQAHGQITTYNQSSYVPMAMGEVIAFLFGNTYAPLFFAVVLYGLANVIEMLTDIRYPKTEKAVEETQDVNDQTLEADNNISEEKTSEQAAEDDITDEEETEETELVEPKEIVVMMEEDPQEAKPAASDENTVEKTSEEA